MTQVDLSALIRRAARYFPEDAVIEDSRPSRRVLAEVVDRAERLANGLDQMGLADGARVAVLAENRIEYVEIDLALALARRVRVALNAKLHVEDFAYILEDCDAQLLFHSATHAETAGELHERLNIATCNIDESSEYEAIVAANPNRVRFRHGSESDTGWLAYTSGTTGRPKGVLLSRKALRHVAMNLLLELNVSKGEQLILSQPLSHGAGFFCLPYLLSGAGLYIQERFDPEAIQCVALRPEVTAAKLVPAMFPDLLALDAPVNLKSMIYGASPISEGVLIAALAKFGPILRQIYGQTEAPMTLTYLSPEDHVAGKQRASAGRPWRSVALEVRDVHGAVVSPGETGEIFVSGDHLMDGYLGLPDETRDVLRDGWLGTRDMGFVDERGFVYLQGRRDEMIISGGTNISPREVERVLLDHPAVDECAVYGQPHERWGTAVCAAIVTSVDVSENDLNTFARTRLGFRAPKELILLPSIPKNAYGKVDREQLLAAIAVNPPAPTVETSASPG